MSKKYKMTISRLTVDKLGVKLYDRVSAVIAELIANSYDADATEVTITAPMDEMLARKQQGVLIDQGFAIEVSDNGLGMLVHEKVNEVNDFYLKVGAERRNDPRRGDKSKKFGRRVMGRKGVGKLAPFGVCQKIEVISSSGDKVSGKDENGKPQNGFITSHFILDRKAILSETDAPYFPEPGAMDETVQPKLGTTIKMRVFDHRRVPKIADFERQMAQRFGLATPNWRIILRDSGKKSGDADYERIVGAFETQLKPGTKVTFEQRANSLSESRDANDFGVKGPSGVSVGDATAGFTLEEKFYPITGWVGYAKEPYKDDLMAGVRIYCRGKIAAQTAVFNMKAGFTGEHDVRSYFIGELHADWLDEDDDLIRTDRQDILWSHDLGQAFQAWGQSLVKIVGRITREPMRKSAWERFQQVSKINERVAETYPGAQQGEIRERTLEMAETIAKSARGDELEDKETVETFVQLSLLLGPHITLDRKLKEAAESKDRPLEVISEVLKTARLAELASFGRIADDRVRVIETLEAYKDTPGIREAAFQKLLTEAPWLINPTWSPITANQSFETLKKEFVKFYRTRTGKDLNLDDFSDPDKQPDFVLSSQDDTIQIIEIKKPSWKLKDEEMARIGNYYAIMTDFLAEPGNEEFRREFPKFHITLVCDGIGLTGQSRAAFDGLKSNNTLTHINWKSFLLKTRKMHEAFLNESDRQRKLAAKRA
jgi:hypothetical protein